MEKKMLEQKDALRFYAFITMRGFEIDNCISTAYIDVCRTLRGIAKIPDKETLKASASNSISGFIYYTLTKSYTQATFNVAHKIACDKLIADFNNDFQITYGQAQKWINMSLKYVYYLYISGIDEFVITEDQKEKLKLNYEFFHIPIDEVVLKNARVKGIIKAIREPGCWSQWNNYDTYLACQTALSEEVEESLLDFENRIWNNSVPK